MGMDNRRAPETDGVDNVDPTSQPTAPTPARSRAITLRSIVVGLLGVLFICVLAPFNDYALNNTLLVGNFLPVGVLLSILVVVIVVNAPLHRYFPKHALRSGELAVSLAMMLASCAIPTSGFMRYVPASIIGIHISAADDARFAAAVRSSGLKDWVLPSFERTDPAQRGMEGIARNYHNRNTEVSGIQAVPWRAWVRPALAWGTLAGFMWGACLCLSVLVHHQWARNERLAFPLAGIYTSLIAAPQRGHVLNETFRSKGFWIAVVAVFCIHGFLGLNQYFPKNVPVISVGFNFRSILTERPLSQISDHVKAQAVYFTIIGICFFLQSRASFSLWGTMLLVEAVLVVLRTGNATITDGAQIDQNLGAMIAFAAVILWVGRAHWAMIARRMIGVRRALDPAPEFIGYAWAGWGMIFCIAGMSAWLFFAGTSLIMSVWITGFILLSYLLLTRIVAETGLMFIQLRGPIFRVLQYAVLVSPDPPPRIDNSSAWMTFWANQTLVNDARENPMTFQSQSLRVADETMAQNDRPSRIGLIGAIALALLVGFCAAGASTLLVEYNYGITLDAKAVAPLNEYAIGPSTRTHLLNSYIEYTTTRSVESHSWWAHVLGGATLTGVLGFLRLHLAWWPLHPVGFLLVYSYPMKMIWFSVFLGWLAKTLVVHYGGAPSLRWAMPIATGLIVGECGAAAFWLVVSVILYLSGQPYIAVRLLPS
jgi:hypothetical protein